MDVSAMEAERERRATLGEPSSLRLLSLALSLSPRACTTTLVFYFFTVLQLYAFSSFPISLSLSLHGDFFLIASTNSHLFLPPIFLHPPVTTATYSAQYPVAFTYSNSLILLLYYPVLLPVS